MAVYQSIIDQSLKRRIFVNAQDKKFVQCVSPKRARIVLKAALGQNNAEIARALDISIKMARHWRHYWVKTTEQSKTVMERLRDRPRPGSPLKFTLEQQVECMAFGVP
ncbi:helix-turn-helix domain-containing protein [Nostoc flagelliforme]|uniref:helix-turn-helix domain-containing protein n=1 Tax=Nostoc flagelliforme TaxID=1306274 RepID=UPI00298E16F9|nr:helix-turn-helix domain-containing protein [Nostoc flagelliforme]